MNSPRAFVLHRLGSRFCQTKKSAKAVKSTRTSRCACVIRNISSRQAFGCYFSIEFPSLAQAERLRDGVGRAYIHAFHKAERTRLSAAAAGETRAIMLNHRLLRPFDQVKLIDKVGVPFEHGYSPARTHIAEGRLSEWRSVDNVLRQKEQAAVLVPNRPTACCGCFSPNGVGPRIGGFPGHFA